MAVDIRQTALEPLGGGDSPCVLHTAGPDSADSAELRSSHVESNAEIPRRRLRREAIWVVAGRSIGIAVTTLVNIALAHWLTPEDFGSFLLLSSVLALASLLAMLGLNSAVVRFVAESLGKGETARARQSIRMILRLAAITIPTVACLAALALVCGGTWILGPANIPGIVPMLVVGLVMLALLQLIAEGCRGLYDVRLASLFSGGQTGGLLSNLMFLLLIAGAIVLTKPSLYTAIALNLAAMAICLPVAVLGFIGAARKRLALLPQGEIVGDTRSRLSGRELLAFAVPMLLIQLLAFTATQADLWIAGITCPRDQLALYGAARRLTLLVALPVQMLNLTMIASIAELYGQRRLREMERALRSAASLTAVPSMFAIVILILFGGPILGFVFGPFFRQAALPLGILGIGQLFLVFAGSCGCTLEMTGNQVTSLIVNLVAAVALVVAGSLSARVFGIVGLAITSSAVIALQSLTLWLLARRVVGVWTHLTLRPSSLAN